MLVGCSYNQFNESAKTFNNDYSKKGSVTPDGGIVVFSWPKLQIDVTKKYESVILRDGYGMMMYYNVDSDNPVVRYELYSHKSKEMFETYSAVKFRKKLAKIEKGEKLHYYNTCAGGTHHALAPDVLNGIKEFCKDRGIIFQEGDDVVFGICTCP